MVDETPPKPCERCGTIMTRKKGEATTRFATRRFCSQDCNRKFGRERNKRPRITLHNDAQAYDDLSHSDRTAIAHECAQIGARHANQIHDISDALAASFGPFEAPQKAGHPWDETGDGVDSDHDL